MDNSSKNRDNLVTGIQNMKQLNLDNLQTETNKLKELLAFYGKTDQLAIDCLNELNSIFDEILKGEVCEPYKEIPCSRYFVDDTLGEYQDLSSCYSKFANLAEGVDRKALDDFFKFI